MCKNLERNSLSLSKNIKINELRLNATIITLEIQLLQKKIAEARINEL